VETKSRAAIVSASSQITRRIAELGDWRGETLARVRRLIQAADPHGGERPSGRWTASSARGNPINRS
jgi:hypothetical protein